MKTNTFLILLAGLAAAPGYAQTNVQVYGLLDAGIEYASNADSGRGGAVRVITSGKNTSRWGLRGTEAVRPGLDLIWNLEGGVRLDTGVNESHLFKRHAWVGLDGDFGRIVIGRSFTSAYDTVVQFDPMSYGAHYSWLVNTNASGAAKYGMTTAFDNLIKYSGASGGLRYSATYGFGEQAGGGANGRKIAAGASWTHGTLAFLLAYETVNGNTVAASGRRQNNTSVYAGVDARHGAWRFQGGVRDYELEPAALDSASLRALTRWGGLTYSVAPLTFTAAVYAVDVRNLAPGADADPVLYVGRVIRALSRRTDLYLSLAHARSGNGKLVSLSREEAGFGSTQSGLTAGIQHRF